MFSTKELKQVLRMVSFISSFEGHELWKLSDVFVHWCNQPVTIKNCLSPTHADHYDLKKLEQHYHIVFNFQRSYTYRHSATFNPQSFTPLSFRSF